MASRVDVSTSAASTGAASTLVELTSPALPAGLQLAGFVGTEALSTPYQLEVVFYLSMAADLDLLAVLGERASLRFRSETAAFAVHGMVIAIEHTGENVERAGFRATLAPALWHLSQSQHSRVFTDKTVPEIIEATLVGAGLTDFEMRLAGSYPKREHTCQYHESDLVFVSRLMERDGIYYFFAQGTDQERLVVCDDLSFHEHLTPIPVRYDPWTGGSASASHDPSVAVFSELVARASALPAKVELTDYDCLRPRLDVRGAASVSPRGRGEVVVYGENTRTPEESEQLARIRAEQYRARELVFRASGFGRFRPGYRFDVEEHPRAALNQTFLTTSLTHLCKVEPHVNELPALAMLEGANVYRIELAAMPATTPYRPPLNTARPRVDGLVDGVTDGPAESPYAQIDEHGRYRVKIFFDESGLGNGSASTWVRMLQPHGGGTEGMHFPLRKETEVHIAFLGGDPDRPVIVGTAPNALKPSKVTEANNSQNVIMTGGSNRIEIEDLEGAQYMTLSTPALATRLHMGTDRGDAFNFVATTEGNAHGFVGGYQVNQTVGYRTDRVTGFVASTFESTVTTHVVGSLTETYDDTHTRTVTGATTVNLQSTLDTTVQGAVTRLVANTEDETITGAATYTYDATKTETIGAELLLHTMGTTTEIHDADKNTAIAGIHTLAAQTQNISADTEQTLSATTQTFAALGVQTHAADTINVGGVTVVNVGAPSVTINADGSVTITSADVSIAGGSVTVAGGTVNLTGGELVAEHSTVTISGGTVDVAGGLIRLN